MSARCPILRPNPGPLWEPAMRGILLWAIGVPIPIILLLYFFVF